MDETIPRVEGLRLVERVDGVEVVGRGEVWRARITGGLAGETGAALPGELPGVGECRVRLLRMPVDEPLRARAQSLARDLVDLDEPGLLPIRAVRRAYDGLALEYGQLPPSPTGLHLIARRRLLHAGEVVTLGVALSWALAHAHAAGVGHGRLSDADVLIGSDGRPVLTGAGVLGVLGAVVEPAADVQALERMLRSLLDRESAGAAEVERALSEGTPNASGLAALLAAAAPALPIAADGPGPEAPIPASRRGRRHSARRTRPSWLRPRVLIAAGGVVLLGGVAGWASAPGPRAQSLPGGVVPHPSAAAQATDWRAVLTALDTAWVRGFEQPTVGFAAVDAPSSPAYERDAAAAAGLRAHGVHAAGLRLVLVEFAVESATAHRVLLRVTDRRPAYELRDGTGRVVSRVAGRGPAAHHIELTPSGEQKAWRIARVTDGKAAVSS